MPGNSSAVWPARGRQTCREKLDSRERAKFRRRLGEGARRQRQRVAAPFRRDDRDGPWGDQTSEPGLSRCAVQRPPSGGAEAARTQSFVRSDSAPVPWDCLSRTGEPVAAPDATGNDHAAPPERAGCPLAAMAPTSCAAPPAVACAGRPQRHGSERQIPVRAWRALHGDARVTLIMAAWLRGTFGRSSSAPLRAAAQSPIGALLRRLHRERASVDIGAVQRLRGGCGVRPRPHQEPESARQAATAVTGERQVLDSTVAARWRANARASRRQGEISNV